MSDIIEYPKSIYHPVYGVKVVPTVEREIYWHQNFGPWFQNPDCTVECAPVLEPVAEVSAEDVK